MKLRTKISLAGLVIALASERFGLEPMKFVNSGVGKQFSARHKCEGREAGVIRIGQVAKKL